MRFFSFQGSVDDVNVPIHVILLVWGKQRAKIVRENLSPTIIDGVFVTYFLTWENRGQTSQKSNRFSLCFIKHNSFGGQSSQKPKIDNPPSQTKQRGIERLTKIAAYPYFNWMQFNNSTFRSLFVVLQIITMCFPCSRTGVGEWGLKEG